MDMESTRPWEERGARCATHLDGYVIHARSVIAEQILRVQDKPGKRTLIDRTAGWGELELAQLLASSVLLCLQLPL